MRRNRFYDEVILMKLLRIAAVGLMSIWAGAASAACPVTGLSVKDGTGTSQILCYGGASGAFINSTAITDSSGNIVGTTTNGVAGLNVSDNKLQVVTASDGLTNPTVPDLLGFLFGYNGSSWDRLRDDANMFLNIDLGATTDTRPVVQNISAADAASTTTAGQNGINQITGTPTAQSAAAQAIQGQAVGAVQITGNGNGTIVFEGASDGSGTTWVPIQAHQRGSSILLYSITGSALNGTYEMATGGFSNVRVRATAWTSGASAPKWSFGQAAGNVEVLNGVSLTSLPPVARNFPGCTVGTSSGSCLAANTAMKFLQVQNTSASASIACAFGATAVLNSSGSFLLAAGQSASWGPNTTGVPTGALNCIASAASTPLYVEWN